MASPGPKAVFARPSWGDRIFRWLCQSSGLLLLLIAASIVGVLLIQAWPFLAGEHFGQLLTSARWEPDKDLYGAQVVVFGTVVTSLIAMLIAVPLGIGSAAFLSEIAPVWVRKICGFLLELLAAIPSIVYGFWAKTFLAKFGLLPIFDALGLENSSSGQGILTAGIVLAIMVLPYITAVSFDVCQAVPRSQREAALSVGATRWQTIWRVVLPYARPGIIAACFLALGRAVGETMAVTMVIGNGQYLPESFSQMLAGTGDTIPSKIAGSVKETTTADEQKYAALVTLGLLLLGVTLLMNVSARLIIAWASKPRVKADRRPIHLAEHLTEVPPPPADQLARSRRRAALQNRVMTAVLSAAQLLTVVPLFLILGYITYMGSGRLKWSFFTNRTGDPEGAGMANALLGSVTLVGLASAFAIPVGLLAAIFLAEFRSHWLAKPIRFVAEMLGSVPSIVIGVFGYALLVRPFWLAPTEKSWGPSAWAGGFALAVMMLPVIVRAAEEAIRLVPNGMREASYALGASRRQTVFRVILPAALPAIITGVLLAVGRVAGETAPLLYTAGTSNFFAESPSEPTPALPYFIYTYVQNPPNPSDTDLAWAGAFVLLMLVLVLNLGTRLLSGQRVVAASRAD